MSSFVRALLVLSCTLVPVFGQAPASTSLPAAGVSEKPFSLEEAIGLAVKKNFDLQVQAFAVENAKDTITIQKSAFDPNLTANATRSVNQAASVTNRRAH